MLSMKAWPSWSPCKTLYWSQWIQAITLFFILNYIRISTHKTRILQSCIVLPVFQSWQSSLLVWETALQRSQLAFMASAGWYQPHLQQHSSQSRPELLCVFKRMCKQNQRVAMQCFLWSVMKSLRALLLRPDPGKVSEPGPRSCLKLRLMW